MLTVVPDKPVVTRLYWAKEHLPFLGLADDKHAVADQYGQQVALLKFGRMPALIIVDLEGRIRYAHYADNMRDYPPMEELFAALDELAQEQGGAPRPRPGVKPAPHPRRPG